MWIAAWWIGLLSVVAGNRVDLPNAALTFEAPAEMVKVTPTPPALYECVVHRRLVERARLTLYVVPCAADATDEAAWARALELASRSGAKLDLAYEASGGTLQAGFVAHHQSRKLRLVRVDQRRILLDLWGETADVDALTAAFDATVASVARSKTPVGDATGPWFEDSQIGIRLRLPFPPDPAHERPLLDGLLGESRPPLYAGLDATMKVSVIRADLDVPLADAAIALRSRTLAVATTLRADDPIAMRAGTFDAARVDYRGDDGAEAIDWLIDLPHHRLLVTASARTETMLNLRPAFEASVASLTSFGIRQIDPAPSSVRELGEHGISFQMPDQLARARRTRDDELIAFVEDFAKSPAPRVVVRSVATLEPGTDVTPRLRATLLARLARVEGIELDAPRIAERSLNGHPAVSASFDVRTAPGMRTETRVLIANGDGAIEFAFETDAAERALFDRCREAILLSLEWTKAVAPPELDSLVTDARCGLKLRPPVGFTRALDDEQRIRFVDGTGLGGGFVEASIAKTPAENRFVRSMAERMRQAVGDRLAADGTTMVRTELAPLTTKTKDGLDDVWITAAYSKDGMPWRELRRDVVLADRVVEIRMAAPAARFRESRQLAEACLRSLAW